MRTAKGFVTCAAETFPFDKREPYIQTADDRYTGNRNINPIVRNSNRRALKPFPRLKGKLLCLLPRCCERSLAWTTVVWELTGPLQTGLDHIRSRPTLQSGSGPVRSSAVGLDWSDPVWTAFPSIVNPVTTVAPVYRHLLLHPVSHSELPRLDDALPKFSYLLLGYTLQGLEACLS